MYRVISITTLRITSTVIKIVLYKGRQINFR